MNGNGTATRRARRRPARPLSALSIELLHLAAGQQGNPRAWHALVRELCARHPRRTLSTRMRELTDAGYITHEGSPRLGWLTVKGHTELAGRLS